ncbi:MAG: hypothetical protein SWH68_12035 [Thermodesulfobacteriota bacterium]|nr:hypothetical protein [Thermodesulfobacteriota bacterium]
MQECCPSDAPCRVDRRGVPDLPLLPATTASTSNIPNTVMIDVSGILSVVPAAGKKITRPWLIAYQPRGVPLFLQHSTLII